MPYEVKDLKRACLIVVNEERLSSNNAIEFGEIMESQLENGYKNIILDLSAVDYFSSAPIREVITVVKHTRERGGDLVLCSPSARVMEVLNLSGIASVFKIFEDQVAAIGSF